jgi:hypothetical protein
MALAGFGVDVAPCSVGLGAPNRPPPNTPDDAPVLEVPPPNREPGVPPGLLPAVVFVDEAFPGVVLKRFPPVAPLEFPNQFCSVMTVIADELFDRVASPKSTSQSANLRALRQRPDYIKTTKDRQQIYRECFFYVFETEAHNTILTELLGGKVRKLLSFLS